MKRKPKRFRHNTYYIYAETARQLVAGRFCVESAAKEVVADAFDHRTGADPLIAGLIRVKIVDGAAGGVGAVEGFLGGSLGGLVDFLVDPAIGDGGEGPGLVDDTGDGVGEGGMLTRLSTTAPTATWPI